MSRLSALLTSVSIAAVTSSCASMTQQEAALMRNQVTRMDERVAFLYKNMRAQADLAANVGELESAVITMRGQIEEFNDRTRMLMERINEVEKSLGRLMAESRDRAMEEDAAQRAALESLRGELAALSLETRAFIRLMEKRSGITWKTHRETVEKIAAEEGVPAPPSRPRAEPEPAPREERMAPGELYQGSYDHYLKGEFDQAIEGFKEYLALYPETSLSDNAAYWIGEAWLGKGEPDKAATAFDEMAQKYPSSNKAPAALLESAKALIGLGADGPALERLTVILEKYPTSGEAIEASEMLSGMGAVEE